MSDFSNTPFEDMMEKGIIAECPQCGKTALRVKYLTDAYHCMACKHSFVKKEAEKHDDVQ